MSTRYRKDMTGEDFQVVRRFKWIFLRITNPQERTVKHYTTLWRVERGDWVIDRIKERTAPVLFATVSEIRMVARVMEIPEGQLINLLAKFNMLALPTGQKDGPRKWKDDQGRTYIGLDMRLSADGRIGRDPSRPPRATTQTAVPTRFPPQTTDRPEDTITTHYRADGSVFYRDNRDRLCDKDGTLIR